MYFTAFFFLSLMVLFFPLSASIGTGVNIQAPVGRQQQLVFLGLKRL
jgi:hypothetical protein